MGKAAIFLAEGFEEIEALTVVDICRRCGIDIDVVSIAEEVQVVSSHSVTVTADKTFSQAEFDTYDMLILPGGMPGTKNLEAHEPLMKQIDAFYARGRYIAAICAAPSIFGHRGTDIDFGLAVAGVLGTPEKAEEIAKAIVYKQ